MQPLKTSPAPPRAVARASGERQIIVSQIDSPLGPIVAAATSSELLALEFGEERQREGQMERLQRRIPGQWQAGNNALLEQTQRQLTEYFAAKRQAFDLPIAMTGTPFQQRVWQQLRAIPYGETRSYGEQAALIDHPKAVRAVAGANGANRIAIIIPCHRIIAAGGKLGGYGGGLWRKRALLALEQGSAP